jgi:hypothetical protein
MAAMVFVITERPLAVGAGWERSWLEAGGNPVADMAEGNKHNERTRSCAVV